MAAPPVGQIEVLTATVSIRCLPAIGAGGLRQSLRLGFGFRLLTALTLDLAPDGDILVVFRQSRRECMTARTIRYEETDRLSWRG